MILGVLPNAMKIPVNGYEKTIIRRHSKECREKKMKKTLIFTVVTLCIALLAQSVQADVISLDAETPETGSNLDTTALVTPFGTISFIGTVLPQYDDDMPSGYAFSTDNGGVTGSSGSVIEPASLIFDFDVESVEFIYGGKSGSILVQALDSEANVVDSFFQNDTYTSQPIGPVTLSGGNIREIRYEDIEIVLVSLDNILIEPAISDIIVPIDIKPKFCPNIVHTKGNGPLQIAICGSDIIDINDIDVASIEIFGVKPTRSSYRDVTSPVVEAILPEDCPCNSDGKDGIVDLLLRFKKQDILNALRPVQDGEIIVLTLTGFLQDGTSIEGDDCIVIAKKGKQEPVVESASSNNGKVKSTGLSVAEMAITD